MFSGVRWILVSLLLWSGCRTASESGLAGVSSWVIQLDGLDRDGAIEALAAASVDMVVIEPTRTVRGHEAFPTRSVVEEVGRDRICLAYVNVGQAEDYRTYWQPFWVAPTADASGSPDYLLSVDPDGWPGNYPVSYWDIRWRAILWGSPGALVDAAIEDGFDGVYLDWVLGFRFGPVEAAAAQAGVDPARAMAELVRDLRAYARVRSPGFLVVIQNPEDLAERVPELYGWIDGVAQESISFGGTADAAWDDPGAGDIATPDRSWDHLVAFRARGLPVFSLDYARDPANIAAAEARSRTLGFVPCVSLSPLDRLP
jgi:cysteinyl-tRNA synthetase